VTIAFLSTFKTDFFGIQAQAGAMQAESLRAPHAGRTKGTACHHL
jgi:hypothetical protein